MERSGTNKGFSTLEVLTAVAIIVILAMIVVGLGRRLKTQAQEKLAASTIEILVTAISQYHEFWDEFPAVRDPCSMPVERSEQLHRQLYSTPNSRKLCEQIQATQIGNTDGDANPEFLDPWGRPLDYRYDDGDSFPAVESAGVDGRFETRGDNISSG